MNTEMPQIETAAREYADVDTALRSLISVINEKIEAVYGEHRAEVRRVCKMWQSRKNALEDLIAKNPALFEKPRTQIFHGIKVGFRKGTGGMDFEDIAETIRLIKKHFADQADVLIHTEETPVKKALAELSAADLKKLGITIEDNGDVVVIKTVETSIEKAIKALLEKTGEILKEAA